jgi:hypothetical protein
MAEQSGFLRDVADGGVGLGPLVTSPSAPVGRPLLSAPFELSSTGTVVAAVPDKDTQGEVRYFAECEIEVHRADGTIEQLGVVAKREVPPELIPQWLPPQEWLRAIGAIP